RPVAAHHRAHLAWFGPEPDVVQGKSLPVPDADVLRPPPAVTAGGCVAGPGAHPALRRGAAGARQARKRRPARGNPTRPSRARKTNGCQSGPIGSARSITPREISLKYVSGSR